MKHEQAWLAYDKTADKLSAKALERIYYTGKSKTVLAAVQELKQAFSVLSDHLVETFKEDASSFAFQLEDDKLGTYLCLEEDEAAIGRYGQEGYELIGNSERMLVKAASDKGIMYGAFALIRELRQKGAQTLSLISVPSNPLRFVNHWDNSDGSIERGYSGESFFFKNGEIIIDERTKDYARLMASIGINSVVINNVNVAGDAVEFISSRYYAKLAKLADIFETYGLKLFLSLDYAASIDIGGLDTADPLDSQVVAFWKEKMEEIFSHIPNFGGFLIKADSEGRPGPFTYGRTQADGANMLARAVAPYGAIIVWRCFVYNCRQDWRDYKTDRARAGYDHFMPLDGSFDDNVVLQIKNGPMDFQVREPVSPLIGGLKATNQILEVQIAQEYTGQQRHVCYLIPMWKEVLEFKTFCRESDDKVKDIVSGKTYHQHLCGMAAVTNTGNSSNWTGHDLAGANLYGYGRLAWDTSLSSEAIAQEWISQTFGNNAQVIDGIQKILMMSWPAYEKYTSPLGIGWMINPNQHYGPNVDGYEYDRWGTYHRADHLGIGVDRSDSGTGYCTQYFEENRVMYNSPETCPEELLLFFHHIPYTYMLSTGKSLIQHIYDSHFEGADEVEEMAEIWDNMKELVDPLVYERTKKRFEHQKDHSKEWRDVVNTYFYRKTFIEDEKKRCIF